MKKSLVQLSGRKKITWLWSGWKQGASAREELDHGGSYRLTEGLNFIQIIL